MNQEISKRIEALIDAFVNHPEDRIHTRDLRKTVGKIETFTFGVQLGSLLY